MRKEELNFNYKDDIDRVAIDSNYREVKKSLKNELLGNKDRIKRINYSGVKSSWYIYITSSIRSIFDGKLSAEARKNTSSLLLIEAKKITKDYFIEKKTIKNNYKNDLKVAKQKSIVSRNIIDENKLLIDSNGTIHSKKRFDENKTKEYRNMVILYNAELKNLDRESKKMQDKLLESYLRSYTGNIDKFWETRLKSVLVRLHKYKKIYEVAKKYSKYSHDFELKEKISLSNIHSSEQLLNSMMVQFKEKDESISALNTKISRWSQRDKSNLVEKIRMENIRSKKEREEVKSQYKSKLISRKAYRDALKRSSKNNRKNIEIIRLEDPKLALIKEKSFHNFRLNQTWRNMEKIRQSSITDAKMTTPIVVLSWFKYVLPFLAILFPGVPQIILGQYKKGILVFLGAMLTMIIFWCFVAGVPGFGYQGNGIESLALGDQTTIQFVNGEVVLRGQLTAGHVVEGVISLIFIMVNLGIIIASLKHTLTQLRSLKYGSRISDWNTTKQNLQNMGLPYAIGIPAIVLTVFIVAVPILSSILIMFTNLNSNTRAVQSGVPLEYTTDSVNRVLSGSFNETFLDVLGWTVGWTLGATFVTLFLGAFFALLVNHKKVKFRALWRLLYLLPWAVPAFITIQFFSVANNLGGDLARLFGIEDDAVLNPLKQDVNIVRLWLIFMQGWLGHCYIFLLVTSGLQNVSKDLYEAARIDGAKPLRQMWRITMPIVLFQIAPLMIGQFAFNFGNFNAIFLYGATPQYTDRVLSLNLNAVDIFATAAYKLLTEGTAADRNESLSASFTFFGSLIIIIPTAYALFKSRLFKKGGL